MRCPSCHKGEAKTHYQLGVIPCDDCRNRQSTLAHPGADIEFTSDDIKEQRKAYSKDILQPHRKGQLSKEWLDQYGSKAAKDRGFSDSEIESAKPVWNDEVYYGN